MYSLNNCICPKNFIYPKEIVKVIKVKESKIRRMDIVKVEMIVKCGKDTQKVTRAFLPSDLEKAKKNGYYLV